MIGSSGSAALIVVVGGDLAKGQRQQHEEQDREERANGGPGGLAGAAPLSAATLLGPARGECGQLPPAPLLPNDSPGLNDPSLEPFQTGDGLDDDDDDDN